ncbi:nucleotidyl transferase AbiEii/AbiGii toxin family protein [Frigoribacterium sp. CG_9.8]|uniref:nucleotidyl transferase AbiEii/AbiGii toxin family protein n=1 Tax=Frigoribacterium sp. CG_9.8 TaxID=2787733 RepID=UPI00351C0274
MALTESQRAVIVSGLGAARGFGFALAGPGALIEHGIASRPTDDADWFSTMEHAGFFDLAVEAVTERLQEDGFALLPVKRSSTFFKFNVSTPGGEVVEVDMSLDWRRYNPAEIAIGPVLDIQDAAAAKVATIFSRGEARDFIDLWCIRKTGLWSDTELFAMAQDRDDRINVPMFRTMLAEVGRSRDQRFADYGLTLDQIADIRSAATEFSAHIEDAEPGDFILPDHTGAVHVKAHANGRGGFTRHHWRTLPPRN